MEQLFTVKQLDIKDRTGNLKAEAHSVVKSTKYFPTFEVDGKKYIFKPLSKTKPLTTPLFAFSEVFWSSIYRTYFDKFTPKCILAEVKGMSDDQPKYSEQGVLVESITQEDEELTNLFDFFEKYPDKKVDIKNYENYCIKSYDYTNILSSTFFQNNKENGEKLAYQILLSILREDQNYHYENVLLKETKAGYEVTSPIDFEFSTPFLYPDQINSYNSLQENYRNCIFIEYDIDPEYFVVLDALQKITGISAVDANKKNIILIVKLYPELVKKFIKQVEKLIEDLPNIKLADPDNFIGPLGSDNWLIGHAQYKENKPEQAEELKAVMKLKTIDKEATFNRIITDVLDFSKYFVMLLKTYLLSHYIGIEDLERLTVKELLEKLHIDKDFTISDINIDTFEYQLKRVND